MNCSEKIIMNSQNIGKDFERKIIHITGELFVKVCDALKITADQLNDKIITDLQEFIVYEEVYKNTFNSWQVLPELWEEWLNK